MKILLNNNDLNEALENVSNLGFVPTMGSLHKGHISLIKQSKKKCNKTIVSIFVNPKQFNNKNDFKKYPRNRKKDLSILKRLKVNYVYLPSVKEIYKVKRSSKITISKKDKILCAKYRKGHFEGVIDVMERLIEYIKPQKIFMGEKDFQQLYLLKKYLRKHSSKIIECRTIREKVLNEFFRVLEPRGILVLADSIQISDSPDFISVMENFYKSFHEPFYCDYIKEDIDSKIEEVGFKDVKSNSFFMTKVWSAVK